MVGARSVSKQSMTADMRRLIFARTIAAIFDGSACVRAAPLLLSPLRAAPLEGGYLLEPSDRRNCTPILTVEIVFAQRPFNTRGRVLI